MPKIKGVFIATDTHNTRYSQRKVPGSLGGINVGVGPQVHLQVPGQGIYIQRLQHHNYKIPFLTVYHLMVSQSEFFHAVRRLQIISVRNKTMFKSTTKQKSCLQNIVSCKLNAVPIVCKCLGISAHLESSMIILLDLTTTSAIFARIGMPGVKSLWCRTS